MTQHTPAPWINTGKEIRQAKTSLILATVYNHRSSNQPTDEAEANARLIAAAPELLEALKLGLYLLTIPAVRDIMKSQLESGESSPIADFETSAHAVITKAKGK